LENGCLQALKKNLRLLHFLISQEDVLCEAGKWLADRLSLQG
jgi:hypothetical protein